MLLHRFFFFYFSLNKRERARESKRTRFGKLWSNQLLLSNLSSPIRRAAESLLSNCLFLFFQTVSPHAEEAELCCRHVQLCSAQQPVHKDQDTSFASDEPFKDTWKKIEIKSLTSQSACAEVPFSCTLHCHVYKDLSNCLRMHAVVVQSRCGAQQGLKEFGYKTMFRKKKFL